MPHHISSVLLCLTPEQFESFRLAFFLTSAATVALPTTMSSAQQLQMPAGHKTGGVKLDPWAVVTIDFVFADGKTVRQRSSSHVDRHRKGSSLK